MVTQKTVCTYLTDIFVWFQIWVNCPRFFRIEKGRRTAILIFSFKKSSIFFRLLSHFILLTINNPKVIFEERKICWEWLATLTDWSSFFFYSEEKRTNYSNMKWYEDVRRVSADGFLSNHLIKGSRKKSYFLVARLEGGKGRATKKKMRPLRTRGCGWGKALVARLLKKGLFCGFTK